MLPASIKEQAANISKMDFNVFLIYISIERVTWIRIIKKL